MDRFGLETEVDISELTSIGNLYTANVDGEGEKAVLNMSTSKEIERMWYVDRVGHKHIIKVGENEVDEVIEVNGAREILVMYYDGSVTRVELEEDAESPAVRNVRREYMILKMTVEDDSGILKIVDDNKRVIKTYEELGYQGDLTLNIAKDANRVYVYDRLNNVTELILSDYPLVDNVYRDKNGNISVVTEGIKSMYYVDQGGNKVVAERNEDRTITVPDGVDSLYLISDNNEEIEIKLPEERIDKTVVKEEENGARIVIDVGNRAVTGIICYGETGREIGRLEGNAVNLDVAMNVPSGAKDVRIVYADGTSNVVELEAWEETEYKDAYQSEEDGTKTVRMRNESGIAKLRYIINERDYEIKLSGNRRMMVDIPNGASDITVVDRFDESKVVTGLDNLPKLTNIQQNSEGEVLINTTETLYYDDDICVEEDEYGRKVVPSGVDSVYTKKNNGEIDLTVDVFDISTQVLNAVSKGSKAVLNVESTKDIEAIVYCVGNEETRLMLEDTTKQLNEVLEDVPLGATAVVLEYVAEQEGNIHKTTKVMLEQNVSAPVAYNTIILEDKKIQVTIEAKAGAKEIQYGEDGIIPIDKNPRHVVFEFDIPEGVDEVSVVDMFGETTRVGIKESEVDTKVESCSKGLSGNYALVELVVNESKGGLASISYTDRTGEKHVDVQDAGTLSYRELLNVNGADEIEITYGDGTSSAIKINVDSEGPEKVRASRNGDGLYSVIMEDRRGIAKVKLGEEILELEDLPRYVTVKIDTSRYGEVGNESGGSNLGISRNGDEVILSARPSSVSERVTLYDGVDNRSDINTRSIDRDTEPDRQGPSYEITYIDGRYILHLEDVAGIENVVGKITREVVHNIEGHPASWTSEESDSPVFVIDGERVIEIALVVSDGLGNETEIPLQVDDGLGAREVWKYIRDEKLHIKLMDSVGITEVRMLSGEIIAEYDNNPLEIELEMDPSEAEYVKVSDIFGHENVIPLNDVTLTVKGAYRNGAGDRIAIDLDNKGKGIRKVTYADGRVIDGRVEEGVREIYDVDDGTMNIRVYYGEDKYAVILLEEDVINPRVSSNEEGGILYRGNGYVLIKAVDAESGIGDIVVGETVHDGGNKDEVVERLTLGGANTIVVRDGLGNEISIDVGDISEDSEVPQASIRYIKEEGRYEIIMSDSGVGLWKVVKNRTEEIWDYSDWMYPKDDRLTIGDIQGIRTLEVYDALGNKVEINLEDVLCIVKYIYKNAADDKVAVSVEDVRGIKKLAVEKDGREKIVEKYAAGQNSVTKCYSVPNGIDAINIYSGDNKMMRWGDIETYEEQPTVNGNSVYSLVGIRKMEYDDGVLVEFRQNMPTKVNVDLVNHSSVCVIDALDNEVIVK